MPGMADVTGDSFGASLMRNAFLAQTRWKAMQSRTARRYMDLHALSASLDLFKPGAIVPWVSYLFPTELLTSYKLTPMIPELGSATLTGTDLREAVESAAARMPLARDVCSYHRIALAAVENDMLPAPSMCLGTTPLCLGKECLLEMLAVRHNVPFREIRVPLPPDEGEASPEVVADVAEQMRVLHEDIRHWTGLKPNLKKAIELSNRASAAWGHIMAERLAGRLEMDGRLTFATVFLGQLLWGTEHGAKDFERLLTERGRSDLMAPVLDGGRRLKRLLWLHTVPHHDPEIFNMLRERDAVVIFEEMGQMHLETVDPDDPFPGLARRLTDNSMWGSSARRARLTVALAKQLKVDGAVHFNHWGCRHGLGSVPVVRAAFMEAGIPFLAIDGDALGRGGAQQEKSRQAMESFLELL
ncbi:MAG: 2-hydroxyacyl-CoA dehydratase [Thermoleophilia bacterium]|nr:2-hydroxyacyl-CoA dehydratase [Thermoleophilia bacterium]